MNEHRENLLKDEYIFLQHAYEDFDRRSLLIKGWSVTIVLGGIAVGIQEESIIILVLAGLASFFFWLLESMWKIFQYCNGKRIQVIESYFRGELDDLQPLQAYATWFEAFRSSNGWVRGILNNMFLGPVLIPHAPAILLVVALIMGDAIGIQIFVAKNT